MINSLWPQKLETPTIELGIPIEKGVKILKELGILVEEQDDNEHSFRVETSDFDIAVYENDGIVSSVWFNDPLGRIWTKGKQMKINLYLARYGSLEDWELRIDNGWMHFFFNDKTGVTMVYGIHKDVIRFNLQSA